MHIKDIKGKRIDTVNKIKNLMLKGEYKKAQIILKDVMKEDPNNPKFKSLMVQCLIYQDKNGRAKDLLNEYIKEFPYDTSFVAQKVELYIRSNETKKAKELLEWLVRNDLADSKILARLKSIEEDRNKKEKIERKILECKEEAKRKKAFYESKDNGKTKSIKNIEKANSRRTLFKKEEEIKETIERLNIETLLGKNENAEEEIKKAEDYLFGKEKFGVIGGNVEIEDIILLSRMYQRIGKKEESREIIEKAEKIKNLGNDEKEKIKIAKRRARQENLDTYIFLLQKDMKENKLEAKQLPNIITKAMKQHSPEPMDVRIVKMNVFNYFGFETSQNDELEQARKKAKTEKQKNMIEIARRKLGIVKKEKQKDDEKSR